MPNGVTIQPNGQTLIVTALSTNPFYTDTDLSSAVTLPATITYTAGNTPLTSETPFMFFKAA